MTWSVASAIANHTMAVDIIRRDSAPPDVTFIDELRILDGRELRLLSRLCFAPDQKDQILRENGMADEVGKKAGTMCIGKGSLAGYLIATYGTEGAGLREEDVVMLREWFERRVANLERTD